MNNIKFKIGDVVSNGDIIQEFKCANMGGMRRSKETNTLVIISDHTKGLYEDKWYDGILHYTGMGKNDDQDINFAQNKTLNQSNSNGVEVHLFEVFKRAEYIYMGQVELAEKPYTENQKGEDGEERLVWMFPLKLKDKVGIDYELVKKYEEAKVKRLSDMPKHELERRAFDTEYSEVVSRTTTSKTYIRNIYVSEYAKRRANGICELCEKEAPFLDRKGNPYLENHHIDWLSEGGEDNVENTVALCPNCHKKMHIQDDPEDKAKLKAIEKYK